MKKLTRLKCLPSLILALAAALSLTACSADTASGVFPDGAVNQHRAIAEVSKRLEQEYGSGFDKTSISRMIKFYQEFPDFEKVATLSQQLTWSHFVEILPIQDELKRDFYAAMCMQKNWSVRTLRERKKSMLYERTAISKKLPVNLHSS